MTESSVKHAEFVLPAASMSPSVAKPTHLHDNSNIDMVANNPTTLDEGTNHVHSDAQELMFAHPSTNNNDSEPSGSHLPSSPTASSSQLEPVLAPPVSHSSNVHTIVTHSKAAVMFHGKTVVSGRSGYVIGLEAGRGAWVVISFPVQRSE
ncbi:hypothetical protein V6N13_036752 [Hibiscus sabdariffa]|uniref:AT-hook motif nuclear-localized protein n=1 Tax=Hibiscus sabdariffa TaxID=183260 RepID=A0ABR2S5G2_9ROSI